MEPIKQGPRSLEEIRKEFEDVKTKINGAVPKLAKKLSEDIDSATDGVFDSEAITGDLRNSIQEYTTSVINFIETTNYPEKPNPEEIENKFKDRERAEFNKLFEEFKKSNSDTFDTLDTNLRKEIEKIFKESVDENLKILLDDLGTLKVSEVAKERLDEAKESIKNDKKLNEKDNQDIRNNADNINQLQGYHVDHPDPETFEFERGISTITRLTKIHGCEVEKSDRDTNEELAEKQREAVKGKLVESLTKIKSTITEKERTVFAPDEDTDVSFTSNHKLQLFRQKKYAEIRDKFSGILAIPSGLDFTSSKSLRYNSYVSLAAMLGVEINLTKDDKLKLEETDEQDDELAEIDRKETETQTQKISMVSAKVESNKTDNNEERDIEKIKQELQNDLDLKKFIHDKDDNKTFIENLALLIQVRLVLNLTDPIDLDELNEDLIQKRLAALEKNENWLRSIVKIGVHEDPSKQPLPTKPEELNSTLETRGVMVRKGLWAQITKDGSLYFVINEHNQENFKEVLNRLKNKSIITWYNIPSKHREMAEIETLQSWKRIEFDNGRGPKETPLSKTMPETPQNWAKWLENINQIDNRTWRHPNNDELKTTLIQKVVGDDEKRLGEFWMDLLKNGDGKLREESYKCFTPHQQEVLNNFLERQVQDISDKIESLNQTKKEDKIKHALYGTQIEGLRESLGVLNNLNERAGQEPENESDREIKQKSQMGYSLS